MLHLRKILLLLTIFLSFVLHSEEEHKQNDIEINLWPILSYKDTPDGGKNLSALLIFNSTLDEFGNQKEIYLFPLFYNIKKEEGNHFGSLIYFTGPEYKIIPPLLSATWVNTAGIKSTWITPMFHIETNKNNSITELHLFNYFYSPGSHIFAPLAWNIKTGNGKHHGLIPLYAKGPNYWTVPLGLSISYINDYHEKIIWITPLFHYKMDNKKNIISSHVLNGYFFNDYRGDHIGIFPLFFKGPDYIIIPPILTSIKKYDDNSISTWITPLFHLNKDTGNNLKSFHLLNIYGFKEKNKLHGGIVPLLFAGPDYWVVPPLLSWSSKTPDNNISTWLTPLFHLTKNKNNEFKSFHFINTYSFKGLDGRHNGFVPFWFSGPDYWVIPPALSAEWKTKKNSTHTWITPLFHQEKSIDDKLISFHYFNYYGYETDNGWKKGFAPLWYVGSNYLISPFLLSGTWENTKGDKNLWLTPLYHETTDKQGELLNRHFLNYYSFTKDEEIHRSLFPIFFNGPDYTLIPPLLSGIWKDNIGDQNLWITPFFHKTNDINNNLQSYHLLNFLAENKAEGWEYNLFPIYKQTPTSWSSPILLSGAWKENRRDHLWLTPLFHITKDENKVVESFHLGPYLNFENKKHILLPIAWYFGKDKPNDDVHYGILPLFIGGSDYFISPLGYGFGEKENFHFGLFPIFAKSPKSLIIPPLLTASWKTNLNEKKTWITPLFHKNEKYNGNITSMHILNYYYTPDFSTIFPVFYTWKTLSGDYSMLIPPFVGFFEGEKLNESILFHAQPITFQKAQDDFEFNLLWQLFHIKKDKNNTELTIGPLWHSNKPRDNKPMEYQILGGLFARDVNYILEQIRYRIMWFLTLTPWRSY